MINIRKEKSSLAAVETFYHCPDNKKKKYDHLNNWTSLEQSFKAAKVFFNDKALLLFSLVL